MKRFKIVPDEGNKMILIIYPLNDKNVTFGFSLEKKDLYQLYLDLYDLFQDSNNENSAVKE